MPPISCTSKWRMLEGAPAGLAAERERVRQERVHRLAVAGVLAQRVGLLAELVVASSSISGSMSLMRATRSL